MLIPTIKYSYEYIPTDYYYSNTVSPFYEI